MRFVLIFQLQGLPKTTNSGGRAHWSVKAKEAKKWRYAVYLITIGKTPDEPLKKANITFTRFSSFEPDYDGLVSSFKHVMDGLVDAGIIESDKPSVVGQPVYIHQRTKPKGGYIEVQVQG